MINVHSWYGGEGGGGAEQGGEQGGAGKGPSVFPAGARRRIMSIADT